jgi:DMSO/TMAO reductase YedYZ molybdopterin-dependent catalytic subunit
VAARTKLSVSNCRAILALLAPSAVRSAISRPPLPRESHVLSAAGALPQARYMVYFSLQPKWWQSIDMAYALHPQTLLVYGMNGGELSMGHGGPLRLRVPRQLGYKSVKFITRITVTDTLKQFDKGGSYAWYDGI